MASKAGLLADRVLQPGGGHTGGFGLTLLQAFPDKKQCWIKSQVNLTVLSNEKRCRGRKWYKTIGLAKSYLRREFSQICKGHIL
jgi:hypothetical protein